MSEEIVACSGCGKKFRIPEGSPPTGKFACTACGADVAWGGSAGGGGGKRAGAKRGAAGKKAKAGGSGRGARRARARKAREGAPAAEGEGDGGGRRGRQAAPPKENKTVPIVVAIMGVVLLAGGLIIAFTGEKPDYAAQAAAEAAAAAANRNTGAVGGLSSSDTPEPVAEPPKPPPVEVAPEPTTDPDEAGEDPQPAEDSGIGGARTGADDGKGYRYWYLRPDAEIFITIEPVEGTTEEEQAELQRLALLATDFDAGSAGMSAERALQKTGRKAVPYLLSQFQVAFNGSKWTEMNDKFAAGKIQQLCRLICKKDGPPSDFVARFDPQGGVPPEHYERAGRMWIAWWNGEGRYIEEFEAYEDEE